MSNREKYEKVFTESFIVEKDILDENFKYNSIPAWDSIGHMSMIAELESIFDIMLDTEDIIDFSSYTKGIEILSKYDIII